MLIADQINLIGDNPLRGSNDDELGVRFPDMSRAFTPEHRELVSKVALDEKIPLREGIFVALLGPSLETGAEYRFLRNIGADSVGMSTVPEVIVAVHGGMRVVGFSMLTDMCLPDSLVPAKIEEILEAAAKAGNKLADLIEAFIPRIEF
jgi:purine-nucleoside phosphorylase